MPTASAVSYSFVYRPPIYNAYSIPNIIVKMNQVHKTIKNLISSFLNKLLHDW